MSGQLHLGFWLWSCIVVLRRAPRCHVHTAVFSCCLDGAPSVPSALRTGFPLFGACLRVWSFGVQGPRCGASRRRTRRTLPAIIPYRSAGWYRGMCPDREGRQLSSAAESAVVSETLLPHLCVRLCVVPAVFFSPVCTSRFLGRFVLAACGRRMRMAFSPDAGGGAFCSDWALCAQPLLPVLGCARR